jgi:hypothetical protein
MATIYNPSENFIKFLDKYNIKYFNNELLIFIENSTLFDELVINSDIETIKSISNDIVKNTVASFCGSLFGKGSFELIRAIIKDVIPELGKGGDYSIDIFKTICTGEDDNIELYHFYCKTINFPEGFNTLRKFNMNAYDNSTIFKNMKHAINHGNYKIFEYTAKNFGLDKNLQRTCNRLKDAILNTDLLIQDYIEITISDIINLDKYPQLEYIVFLLENRKIIFTNDDMLKLKKHLENKPESIKELFQSVF